MGTNGGASEPMECENTNENPEKVEEPVVRRKRVTRRVSLIKLYSTCNVQNVLFVDIDKTIRKCVSIFELVIILENLVGEQKEVSQSYSYHR